MPIPSILLLVERLEVISYKVFHLSHQFQQDTIDATTVKHEQIQWYVVHQEETFINDCIQFLH